MSRFVGVVIGACFVVGCLALAIAFAAWSVHLAWSQFQ